MAAKKVDNKQSLLLSKKKEDLKPNGGYSLVAEKREITGKQLKKLRRQGILPANVYGKKIKSQTIQVNLADFQKIFTEAGETGLVYLKVGTSTHPILIHNIHADPVSDLPLHADFLQVDLKEKVTATVPIEFTGESPVEKTQEGIVVPQVREVEVEALPTDLPEQITVDISGLEKVDDAIKVADLKVDREKVEIKDDPERIVVSVAPPAKEEVVEEAPAEEGAEGEAPAEGETPAEGEQPTEVETPERDKKEE